MPSLPVHLLAAQMLCERLGVSDKPSFLLGSIAPDSVNMKGFADKETRYKAHIRSTDYDIWKKQLSDFYTENAQAFSDCADYLKGYVFHCITDIAWDESVQPGLFTFLQKDASLTREQITKLKWEELFRFNSLLVKEELFTVGVELLKLAQPHDIAGITAQQISDYRDYAVNDYKDKIAAEMPYFLKMEHVNICAQRTFELYRQIIQ